MNRLYRFEQQQASFSSTAPLHRADESRSSFAGQNRGLTFPSGVTRQPVGLPSRNNGRPLSPPLLDTAPLRRRTASPETFDEQESFSRDFLVQPSGGQPFRRPPLGRHVVQRFVLQALVG